MDARPSVLFLCTGNSCRSQMAEGWLRSLTAGRLEVHSAGTHPKGVHPRAVEVMKEVGVDLSAQTSDRVESYLQRPLDLVVTVCGSAAATCPNWPGAGRVVHWPFDDPAEARGSDEEVLAEFRRVRDEIGEHLRSWLDAGMPELVE